jgi:hypothetical protein
MGGLALVRNGDQVIDALGLSGKTYAGTMKHLAALTLFNIFLSWMGLLSQKRSRGPRRDSFSVSTQHKHSGTSSSSVADDLIPVVTKVSL